MDHLEALRNLNDLITLVGEVDKIQKKRKPRAYSVRPINRERSKTGFFVRSFLRMKKEDPGEFFKHCRLTKEKWEFVLSLIGDKLKKKSIRKSISPECRLAVTLCYLAQGVSIQYLASSNKLGKETVRKIIIETCEVIWDTFKPLYVCEPNATDFENISKDFENIWQVPNCVGSIDGKHIAITQPKNSGALYFNYLKYYSIVFLAICDAKYTFTYIDVGSFGGNSDGGIFANSYFGQKIVNNTLPLPSPRKLPGSDFIAPYYFVADAAFPLACQIVKPYAGRNVSSQQIIYNKKICRARQTIENSFGILTARWRILLNTIHMEPQNAEKVVLACVALHNFIMLDKQCRTQYCPEEFIDFYDENGTENPGQWRLETSGINSIRPAPNQHTVSETSGINSIQPSRNQHRYNGMNATNFRNALCNYFNEIHIN